MVEHHINVLKKSGMASPQQLLEWERQKEFRKTAPIDELVESLPVGRRKVWNKTNGLCFYCGVNLRPFMDCPPSMGFVFVSEHYIPTSRGGRGNIDNLFPSCSSCNAQKGSDTISEWRDYLAIKRSGIPSFSEEQILWLKSNGFCVYDCIEKIDHSFWAEKNGWLMCDEGATKI